MSETAPQSGYLRQAWLVILLALLYGGALAGVEVTLGPRIAENKRQETYERIPDIVPGADQAKTIEHVVTGADGKEQRVYQAFAADGKCVGWVILASGQGFADRIDVLIGLNAPLEVITGLWVLDQKETPGLGDLIRSEDFRDQFAEKRAESPLVVVKDEPAPDSNEIRALSGATISSESVATIVNRALDNLRGAIRELPLDESPAQPSNDPGPSSETKPQEAK